MKYQFEPFIVNYDPIITPLLDFKEECIIAAKNAVSYNVNNLHIAVMMSGGIDSQFVAESLFLANIPFTCVIGRLQNKSGEIFNKHDYEYAERWCQEHNIDKVYCDIDIFTDDKILIDYALSAQSFSPQYACHMYIMKWCSDKGYFFIAGNGEMDIVLIEKKYYMMDEQREFTLNNFCILNDIPGVFQFWKQDGRLISAFLNLPTVKLLMSAHVTRLLDHKHACFSDIFEFEDRTKKTGFELIQEWDMPLRKYLKERVGQYDQKYYTPITHFLTSIGN